MRTKKVLLFSRDPGGANTVMPLYRPLVDAGYETELWGKDVSLGRYAREGLPVRDIMGRISRVSVEDIRSFLMAQGPDIVVTGTSANDPCEKYIWKAAEGLGIVSFAILDQWLNYGVRFAGHPVSGTASGPQPYEYLPSKILLMDDLARTEAVRAGLPPERLVVTGQPHFQALRDRRISAPEALASIRHGWGVTAGESVVVFVSEPITEDHAKSPFGYTEKNILEHLTRALEIAGERPGRKFCLVIRPHPREDARKFRDLSGSLFPGNVRAVVDDSRTSFEIICAADIICGMSSMFLLESVILGKPVMSIQIGLKGENPFVLDRLGILKSVLDPAGLQARLEELLSTGTCSQVRFELVADPVGNVLEQVRLALSTGQ